jgi:hypothetical protein
MFDHIRMIVRWIGATGPLIGLGGFGAGMWRTGYVEITGSLGHHFGAERGAGFAAHRQRAR